MFTFSNIYFFKLYSTYSCGPLSDFHTSVFNDFSSDLQSSCAWKYLEISHCVISRVKFEKVNIWKSKHFMLKVKIISSYEQICTCSSWFSFLSKQTISRPKYFDHWKDHCSYISSAYAVFWKHILDLWYLCYFHLSNVKVLNPPNNKFW